MTTQAKRLKSIGGRRRLVLSILAAAVALPAAADDMEQMHASHVNTAPARLVELVRPATQQFLDVNADTASGYQPFLGCVTGPDHGAMGICFVHGALVGDGEIDASHPEALIYEPANGVMRLVGVEFIVDADAWMAAHTSPPVLEGQTFQLVGSPNRYGLAPFSSCTSGRGATTPTGLLWTGTHE